MISKMSNKDKKSIFPKIFMSILHRFENVSETLFKTFRKSLKAIHLLLKKVQKYLMETKKKFLKKFHPKLVNLANSNASGR